MERGAYYLHIMRAIEGIDMTNLEEKVIIVEGYSLQQLPVQLQSTEYKLLL